MNYPLPLAPLDFLAPTSIMVVGASANPAKRGYSAIAHLLRDQFDGSIYPVNPKLDTLLGLPCFGSIESVPASVDLALICTRAESIPEILTRCGQQGVKGAVILASGFSETGTAGSLLEQRCVTAARKQGIRLIGPNTSGMFNTHRHCNLVGFNDLRSGPVGIISQSGNMALSLVTESLRHPQLGFSSYIGVGNEADIAFHEYLYYFAADKQTRVIATYVEGLSQGKAFLDAARDVSPTKPIVMYKSGRTASGQNSARSHTGALAGDFKLCRGVMQQAGVILVERSDHLLPISEALAMHPPARGKNVAILADGGGHATIAADELSELGLQLATLNGKTLSQLSALLGPHAPVNNPVDFAGASDTRPELFAQACDLLLGDTGVDALLVVGLFGGYQLRFSQDLAETENHTATRLCALQQTHQKPLIVHSVYKHHQTRALRTLSEGSIPVQDSLEIAVHCVNALVHYGAVQQRSAQSKTDKKHSIKNTSITQFNTIQNASTTSALTSVAVNTHSSVMTEVEGRALLKQQGIQLTESILVETPEQLEEVANTFGNHPLAMKIVSPQIIHKSDAGGVKLNLKGSDQLARAFAEITRNAFTYNTEAQLDGVLVTPMAQSGIEIILGITRDAQFGPVLMFGVGGIHVEVLRDVSFRSLPISLHDATEMLNEIQCHKLLDGVRGAAAIDRDALVKLMMQLSELFLTQPQLSELELNPVILYEEGLEIVDVRALLMQQTDNMEINTPRGARPDVLNGEIA